MQITSLYIEDYKLLKNFTKDVSILTGINDSGKSIILEAIALIFSDALLSNKSFASSQSRHVSGKAMTTPPDNNKTKE